MSFGEPPAWTGPSNDPNDQQFGDLIEPATLESASDTDCLLIGEPYDGAVIGRRGAAAAPAAIRDVLAGITTYPTPEEPPTVGDLGDVAVRGVGETTSSGTEPSVADVQAAIQGVTERIHATDSLPIFLGGDNSLTVPNATPLLDSGSLGIVSLDAHLDCRSLHAGPSSGTPYRQLHDRGLDRQVVLGARPVETSSAYHEYLANQGGSLIPATRVSDDPEQAAAEAVDAIGDVDHLYVSLDMDVLDAAFGPGVSAPTPGGLSSRELFAVIGPLVADDRLAGVELVECAPPLDRDGLTVGAAARAVAHILGGVGA